MKVHLYPDFGGEDKGDGGIRRVWEGQRRSLPALGIEFVDRPEDADVIACHAIIPPAYLARCPGKPIVAHNHGLYWAEFEWGNWAIKENREVMGLITVADIVTAPTEWVAQSIRRHTMRDVRVVPHGIDAAEWAPVEAPPAAAKAARQPGDPCCPERFGQFGDMKVRLHDAGCEETLPDTPDPAAPDSDYVLWNKTRVDPVCDPSAVAELARRMPDVKFRTTFGIEGPNTRVTGRLPFERAKGEVQRAAVYLATVRETFGVGTLEALAAGVPVVGWKFGGQEEFIEHGVDGWLAPVGDYDSLVEGVRWALANRATLVESCMAKAASYSWARAAAQYRDVYQAAIDLRAPGPKVTVIVTAYNLAQYLPSALNSVLAQSLDSWECIVVDDASPDECGAIADEYAARDPRFRVVHNAKNYYLAQSRNIGLALARGEYVLPLDADDELMPGALGVLSRALDVDRSIHIAYGNVEFVGADGVAFHSGWPIDYDWEELWAMKGQPGPYSSMFRRRALELTGGYRARIRSSEDQDVWLRAASYGFRPKMVTSQDVLRYRIRGESMSQTIGWGNHRPWYPWALDGRTTPAGASTEVQVPVHSCDPPIVSVVIPVGPGHEQIVIDAIDSVDAQTYRRWECIVVWDSPEPIGRLPSWVKVIDRAPCPTCDGSGLGQSTKVAMTTDGVSMSKMPGGCETCRARGWMLNTERPFRLGVARARNLAIAAARAEYYLPLDADDFLQPRALSVMLEAAQKSGSIIYSDFWEDPTTPGEFTVLKAHDWDPVELVYEGTGVMGIGVTQLTPVSVWRQVGGYDPHLPGWEDWAFALDYAAIGQCAARVALPLWTYRKHTGKRRDENVKDTKRSRDGILKKFGGRFWNEVSKSGAVVRRGEDIMACRSCSGRAGKVATSIAVRRDVAPPAGAVKIEYIGTQGGTRTFRGKSGTRYPFDIGVWRWVQGVDVEFFDQRPDFRRMEEPEATGEMIESDGPELAAEAPANRPEPETAPAKKPAAKKKPATAAP